MKGLALPVCLEIGGTGFVWNCERRNLEVRVTTGSLDAVNHGRHGRRGCFEFGGGLVFGKDRDRNVKGSRAIPKTKTRLRREPRVTAPTGNCSAAPPRFTADWDAAASDEGEHYQPTITRNGIIDGIGNNNTKPGRQRL